MRLNPSKKVCCAFIATILLSASLLVMFFFPVHRTVATWKGYRILAVPQDRNEQDVLDRLTMAGIRGIVTESDSEIASEDDRTPILPFLSKVNAYRARWFSDSAGKFRLFYLEETSFLDIRVKKALEKSTSTWILERTGEFSGIPVICVSMLLLAGIWMSRRKDRMLAGGIPFVFLSASCNDPVGFYAACLSIFALFLLSGHSLSDLAPFSRKAFRGRLSDLAVYALFSLIPYVVAGFGGIHHVLLQGVALTASVASAVILSLSRDSVRALLDTRRLHPAFRPVRMVHLSPFMRTERKRMMVLSAIMLLLMVSGSIAFAFADRNRPEGDASQELYIPAPTGYTKRGGFTVAGLKELDSLKEENGLPDLSDFIAAKWNIRIYPWKKIRNPPAKPEPGDTLDEVRYSVDDSGKIPGVREPLDTFDTAVIRRTLSSDCTPLERMLMRQGRFVSVTFKRLMQ